MFPVRMEIVAGREPDIGVTDIRRLTYIKKALYLATTRAKHYLGIHWSGQQSPILKSISERGINWYRD